MLLDITPIRDQSPDHAASMPARSANVTLPTHEQELTGRNQLLVDAIQAPQPLFASLFLFHLEAACWRLKVV